MNQVDACSARQGYQSLDRDAELGFRKKFGKQIERLPADLAETMRVASERKFAVCPVSGLNEARLDKELGLWSVPLEKKVSEQEIRAVFSWAVGSGQVFDLPQQRALEQELATMSKLREEKEAAERSRPDTASYAAQPARGPVVGYQGPFYPAYPAWRR